MVAIERPQSNFGRTAKHLCAIAAWALILTATCINKFGVSDMSYLVAPFWYAGIALQIVAFFIHLSSRTRGSVDSY